MSHPPLIFIIAGEASGDQLGADLMVSLRAIQEVRFVGIGGEAMRALGLQSLFPMEELSLMGVFSILRNLFNLRRRLNHTIETIQTLKPDVVVTIDAPEFSFRVMKRLHKMSPRPRLIHYVAPTVWAWRPGRAKKIAHFLDHLLCLYPFEPPYFKKYGLNTTFVGHPIAREYGLPRSLCSLAMTNESVIASEATQATPEALGYARLRRSESPRREQSRKKIVGDREPNLLCLLPGSRRSEIEMLLPVFRETVMLLKKDIPDLKVAIPTLLSREPLVRQGIQNFPVEVQIIIGDEARKEIFQKASAALAASGTVALQLSAARLPFVIAYKIGKITAWIGRFLLNTPWACMVNILLAFKKFGSNFILNQKAKALVPFPWIPEFIQNDCTAEKLAPALLRLLKDQEARNRQIIAMEEAISLLKAPTDAAAKAVLEEITSNN